MKLRSVKLMRGFSLQASDGEVGQIDDYLFDDQSWAIRYLVVNTGNWLMDRKVLVLPAALDDPNWEAEILNVTITKQQIEDSPPIGLDQPVSRQVEAALHDHYNWPAYWSLGMAPLYPLTEQTLLAESADMAKEGDIPKRDPNLRSVAEVTGYTIDARDGDVGHVEDFVVDDENWIIRYMIVDTHNWLPGRKVLVSPTWIEDIAWDTRRVQVDLKRGTIKRSPGFDPTQPISPEYEQKLYDYYGRPQHWVSA